MGRLTERLIDLAALAMFLLFAFNIIDRAPELAGGVVVGASAFWLTKNASAPHVTQEQATATAAAEVLAVAARAAEEAKVTARDDVGEPIPSRPWNVKTTEPEEP